MRPDTIQPILDILNRSRPGTREASTCLTEAWP